MAPLPPTTATTTLTPQHPASAAVPRPRTICGLRRKAFWGVLGTLLIFVIAGAVVGGVVGSRADDDDDDGDDEGVEESSLRVLPNGMSPQSQLAAVNWTHPDDGAERYSLFFQDEALALRRADYNVTGNAWGVAGVVADGTGVGARHGTPVAAYVMGDGPELRFNVWFLDENNTVRGVVSGLDDAAWRLSAYEGAATEDSGLAAYGGDCEWCVPGEGPVFLGEDEEGGTVLKMAFLDADDTWQERVVASQRNGSAIADGAAISVVPAWHEGNVSTVRILVAWDKVYEYEAEGNGNWTSSALTEEVVAELTGQRTIAANTQFVGAAMQLHVLTTLYEGAVMLTGYSEEDGAKADLNDNTLSMPDVTAFSPIAMNQAGRAYAFVNVDGGKQLHEWYFDETGELKRIGSVDFLVDGYSRNW